MMRDITISQGITNIPNLVAICRDFTDKWSICQLINDGKAGFSPIQVPNFNSTFERINIDLMERSTSREGFNYVLIVVDHFSKYTILKALRSKSAAEVGEALFEIFGNFGTPL